VASEVSQPRSEAHDLERGEVASTPGSEHTAREGLAGHEPEQILRNEEAGHEALERVTVLENRVDEVEARLHHQQGEERKPSSAGFTFCQKVQMGVCGGLGTVCPCIFGGDSTPEPEPEVEVQEVPKDEEPAPVPVVEERGPSPGPLTEEPIVHHEPEPPRELSPAPSPRLAMPQAPAEPEPVPEPASVPHKKHGFFKIGGLKHGKKGKSPQPPAAASPAKGIPNQGAGRGGVAGQPPAGNPGGSAPAQGGLQTSDGIQIKSM